MPTGCLWCLWVSNVAADSAAAAAASSPSNRAKPLGPGFDTSASSGRERQLGHGPGAAPDGREQHAVHAEPAVRGGAAGRVTQSKRDEAGERPREEPAAVETAAKAAGIERNQTRCAEPNPRPLSSS